MSHWFQQTLYKYATVKTVLVFSQAIFTAYEVEFFSEVLQQFRPNTVNNATGLSRDQTMLHRCTGDGHTTAGKKHLQFSALIVQTLIMIAGILNYQLKVLLLTELAMHEVKYASLMGLVLIGSKLCKGDELVNTELREIFPLFFFYPHGSPSPKLLQ